MKSFAYLFMAGAVSSLLLAACSTSYINQPVAPLNITATTIVDPDIQVGDKIDGTATVGRIFFFFVTGSGKYVEGVNYGGPYTDEPVSSYGWFGDTIAEAKAAAAYQACTQNKADFIIAPRYYIVVDDYFFYRRTKARVFGYKGVLTGVEKHAVPAPVVQPVQLTSPVQIAQPVKIEQPIKIQHDQPIKIEQPLSLSQPLEIKDVTPPQPQQSQQAPDTAQKQQ